MYSLPRAMLPAMCGGKKGIRTFKIGIRYKERFMNDLVKTMRICSSGN